uniref:Uncharacterized protein n=1 Tax=Phlebotomus papatasi TaxID=29031 RepID=A0A1B0D4A1_PHLPP
MVKKKGFGVDDCFVIRLIKHTEKLLEEKEEKLCVKVLRTLREMMAIDVDYGEKGDTLRSSLLTRYFGKNFSVKAAEDGEQKKIIPVAPVTHGPGGEFICHFARFPIGDTLIFFDRA